MNAAPSLGTASARPERPTKRRRLHASIMPFFSILSFSLYTAVTVAFAAQPPSDADDKLLKTKTFIDILAAIESGAKSIELPFGETMVPKEIVIPAGSGGVELRGHPQGSTLRASSGFRGRAVILAESASGLVLNQFRVAGSRSTARQTVYLPPSDVSFAQFFTHNGLLIDGCTGVRIEGVSLDQIAGFAILVSRSSDVTIQGVMVEDSGSLDAKGRNNTSGGILLEEGTSRFAVRDSTLRRIRGNAIWTHSNYHSPRNGPGVISGNTIDEVARDAIQIGHATGLQAVNNTARRVGFPATEVDLEGQGIPVGLDAAGNVDKSAYLDNRLEDVNGQCIDLDGFHDGEVLRNTCVNRKPIGEYPFAHAAIVFGNTHPEVQPTNITVADNLVDGAGYGGVFLIGSGNRVINNRLLNLNRNGCTGAPTPARCAYALDQPGLLRSGIYLGNGAARPSSTTGNLIEGNEITGFGMGRWCIEAAPGEELSANRIGSNSCRETSAPE